MGLDRVFFGTWKVEGGRSMFGKGKERERDGERD